MKISTKGRYAVEIMSDLAVYASENSLESLRNIAERRGLSEKYLERIVRALREAGLVNSVRGVYGGYSLSREAHQITVKEVLTAVEGELTPVACLIGETDCTIGCEKCPTRGTWNEMWSKILEVVDSVTIADIVESAVHREKNIDTEYNSI